MYTNEPADTVARIEDLQVAADRAVQVMLALPLLGFVALTALVPLQVLDLFTLWLGRVVLLSAGFIVLSGTLVANRLGALDPRQFPTARPSWVDGHRRTFIRLTALTGALLVISVIGAYLALR